MTRQKTDRKWVLVAKRPRLDQTKGDPELLVATHGPFGGPKEAEAFVTALANGNGIEWGTSTEIVDKLPKEKTKRA